MSYKDTLKLYDELIAGGCTEPQARVQAEQLGAVGNVLDELKQEMRLGFQKLDKDIYWMRLIGAAMIVTFLGNIS